MDEGGLAGFHGSFSFYMCCSNVFCVGIAASNSNGKDTLNFFVHVLHCIVHDIQLEFRSKIIVTFRCN